MLYYCYAFNNFNKRDPGSYYLGYGFAYCWRSFVDSVASFGLVDVAAPNIRTCFANDVITFCLNRMALDQSKRSHDSMQHPHHNGLLDPIVAVYPANHNRANLLRILLDDLLLYACVPSASPFSYTIPNLEHQAIPKRFEKNYFNTISKRTEINIIVSCMK